MSFGVFIVRIVKRIDCYNCLTLHICKRLIRWKPIDKKIFHFCVKHRIMAHLRISNTNCCSCIFCNLIQYIFSATYDIHGLRPKFMYFHCVSTGDTAALRSALDSVRRLIVTPLGEKTNSQKAQELTYCVLFNCTYFRASPEHDLLNRGYNACDTKVTFKSTLQLLSVCFVPKPLKPS